MSLDVAYAGVNYAEVLFRSGVVPGLELPFTPGIEASGHVREVGEGVAGLRAGQRVAALTIVGGYAEVAVAPAALAVPCRTGSRSPRAPRSPPTRRPPTWCSARSPTSPRGRPSSCTPAAGGVGSSLLVRRLTTPEVEELAQQVMHLRYRVHRP